MPTQGRLHDARRELFLGSFGYLDALHVVGFARSGIDETHASGIDELLHEGTPIPEQRLRIQVRMRIDQFHRLFRESIKKMSCFTYIIS